MNVLVTGANGYLGGWVCHYLKERGHKVLFPHERFKIDGTLGIDPRLLDAIVHLGWRSKAGSNEPEKQVASYRNTISLVKQLTSKMLTGKLTCKLVFASTCSVYGSNSDIIPCKEDATLLPNCSYTWAKVAAEEYIKTFLPERSLVFRLGSLMGQGVTHAFTKLDVVVNAFAFDGYNKGIIECWSPEAWKPLLHVQDAARIIVEGVERSEWIGTYNAASTSMQAITIAQLAADITEAEIHFVDSPHQQESPRSARVNTSRLDRELPGMCYRTVEEAIREFG